MKTLTCVIAAVVMGGCQGFRFPSERAAYKLACETAAADASFPSGAVILGIDKANINAAKNAARVDLPYSFVTASGATVTNHYTVWLKRIARRWELDRYRPAPQYSGAAGPEP